MNILDKSGVEFFQKQLLAGNDRALALFEMTGVGRGGSVEEMGRIGLYEERMTIKEHFDACDEDLGVFMSNHPQNALLGRKRSTRISQALHWQEMEGIRFDIRRHHYGDLEWTGEESRTPPRARLTSKGEITKRPSL